MESIGTDQNCTLSGLPFLIEIDDPYSLEQLKSPRMNISVVRPLVDQLYELQDVSIGTIILLFIVAPCPLYHEHHFRCKGLPLSQTITACSRSSWHVDLTYLISSLLSPRQPSPVHQRTILRRPSPNRQPHASTALRSDSRKNPPKD